jgi:hypothetical protein
VSITLQEKPVDGTAGRPRETHTLLSGASKKNQWAIPQSARYAATTVCRVIREIFKKRFPYIPPSQFIPQNRKPARETERVDIKKRFHEKSCAV